jgi:predicted RNA-binding Zn ribbon-like protein
MQRADKLAKCVRCGVGGVGGLKRDRASRAEAEKRTVAIAALRTLLRGLTMELSARCAKATNEQQAFVRPFVSRAPHELAGSHHRFNQTRRTDTASAAAAATAAAASAPSLADTQLLSQSVRCAADPVCAALFVTDGRSSTSRWRI